MEQLNLASNKSERTFQLKKTKLAGKANAPTEVPKRTKFAKEWISMSS